MSTLKQRITVTGIAFVAIAGLVAIGIHLKKPTAPVQPQAQTQQAEQVPPALAAASCGAHLGAIGFLQEKEGDMVNGQANLNRFVALDNQWANDPEYKRYQKNIDHNLAQDKGNIAKNLVMLGEGCDVLGIPRAQVKQQ